MSSSDEYQIIRENSETQMEEQPVHSGFSFIYSLDPEIGGLDPLLNENKYTLTSCLHVSQPRAIPFQIQ